MKDQNISGSEYAASQLASATELCMSAHGMIGRWPRTKQRATTLRRFSHRSSAMARLPDPISQPCATWISCAAVNRSPELFCFAHEFLSRWSHCNCLTPIYDHECMFRIPVSPRISANKTQFTPVNPRPLLQSLYVSSLQSLGSLARSRESCAHKNETCWLSDQDQWRSNRTTQVGSDWIQRHSRQRRFIHEYPIKQHRRIYRSQANWYFGSSLDKMQQCFVDLSCQRCGNEWCSKWCQDGGLNKLTFCLLLIVEYGHIQVHLHQHWFVLQFVRLELWDANLQEYTPLVWSRDLAQYERGIFTAEGFKYCYRILHSYCSVMLHATVDVWYLKLGKDADDLLIRSWSWDAWHKEWPQTQSSRIVPKKPASRHISGEILSSLEGIVHCMGDRYPLFGCHYSKDHPLGWNSATDVEYALKSTIKQEQRRRISHNVDIRQQERTTTWLNKQEHISTKMRSFVHALMDCTVTLFALSSMRVAKLGI